ncbi:MAG TPA: biotin/lipoyl-binding protein, partial [Cyclobacteriaceae bacterium]|nr:biotin/lipoyl-binding protein [Cyclobacteriaceae bacterium]
MDKDGIPKYPVPLRTNYIYIVSLSFILTTVLILPFIKTDVGINASGIVRPSSEVCVIRSASSGRIKTIYLNENKLVKKDDVLLTIESEILNEQEKFIIREIVQNQSFVNDINRLLQFISQPVASPSFENPVYWQFYQAYNEKVNEISVRLNKSKLDFDRQTKLFQEKVIAPAEYENFQFELLKLTKALDHLKETELSQWHREHKDLKEKIQELESRLIQIQKKNPT